MAHGCLEGKAGAIRELQETYRPVLIAYLRNAGASLLEAEEVTEWLWADCLMERPNRRPRLALYDGESSLKTWLFSVALNRLIARKRSEELWGKILQEGLDAAQIDAAGVDEASIAAEAPLVELLREAVEAGFAACAAEDFVLLQLAHMDRLRMFELARMFDCSTSKIDRDLERAGATVEQATLGHIRKVDPWLDLRWEDFVELCRVARPACFGLD